jgi:hypothetical protein
VKQTELLKLLAAQGIDLDDVGQVDKIRTSRKVEDETGATWTVSFSPKWEQAPAWQPVRPAAAVKVTGAKAVKPSTDGLTTLFLFPDTQIGFHRDPQTGDMIPMHDTGAIDVGLQILESLKSVDAVGYAGDQLDLTDMSKFVSEPAAAQNTQAAIDWCHKFMAIARKITPHARHDLMEGNHDMRLAKYITMNAKAAYGLKKAGAAPDAWPELSVPNLLRLDELDVTYHVGFPAAMCWYRDDLAMEHGKTINPKSLGKKTAISRLMGHVHRLEAQSHTLQTGKNTVSRSLTVAFGTMSRVDGAVPSFGSGVDGNGMPVKNVEDWAQGCAVLTFDENDVGGPITYELIPIHEGTAIHRGRKFEAGKWFDKVVPL